jgi:hypothetical protein
MKPAELPVPALAEYVLEYQRAESPSEQAARLVAEAFRLSMRHGQDRITGRRRAEWARA